MYKPPEDHPIYNLNVAYGVVKERLAKINIADQCLRSGAECQPDGTILLKYLNETYKLDGATADVRLEPSIREVSLRDKILVLHYFSQAKGTLLTGKQITYRDLPGGLVYYPTFIKRTIKPLADAFGKQDAQVTVNAGKIFAARQGGFGDASLIIEAFPKVPITIVLWVGDDELTPELNILFDSSISDYLESEDVTVVCETITWRLINAAKNK